MKMTCNMDWKFMVCLMVLDMAMCLSSSFAWATDLVSNTITNLVDRDTCTGDCLTSTRTTVATIQIFACGLYAATALAAGVSILGLLSGRLWLQVPNVAVSFIRMVGSVVIGDLLIQVNIGAPLFAINRIIQYFCLVVNFLTFSCNLAQAIRQYRCKLLEVQGLSESRDRPFEKFFDRIFEASTTNARVTPASSDGIPNYEGLGNNVEGPSFDESFNQR